MGAFVAPPIPRERFRVRHSSPNWWAIDVLLRTEEDGKQIWCQWDGASSEAAAEEKIGTFMRRGVNDPFCD
jgi:hypothetical protein